MSSASVDHQVIICWNCKASVSVPNDQIHAASCSSCAAGLNPEVRDVPIAAFMEEQRRFRTSSKAGPLTDSEAAHLGSLLTEQASSQAWLERTVKDARRSRIVPSWKRRLVDWCELADSLGFAASVDEQDRTLPRLAGDLDGFPVDAGEIVEGSGDSKDRYLQIRVTHRARLSPGTLIQRRSPGRTVLDKMGIRSHRLLTGDSDFDNTVSVNSPRTRTVQYLTPERRAAVLHAVTKHHHLKITDVEIIVEQRIGLRRPEPGAMIRDLVDLAKLLSPTSDDRPTQDTTVVDPQPDPKYPVVSGELRLRAADIADKKFRVALRGYSEDEVDGFLDRIAKTLREYEAGRRGELTTQGIEQQTFRVALRGYAEEEVDQFLGEVVQTLRDYENLEIEKLTPPVSVPAVTKEGPGSPALQPDTAVPVPPEPTQPVATEHPVKKPPSNAHPSPTVTRLIVTRTAEPGGRPYMVLLDDKPLGKVSPDSTQRFEIPAGMHWVTVKTRKEQSNTLVIEPDQGDQITLRCGPASGQIDDLGRKMEGIILETVG